MNIPTEIINNYILPKLHLIDLLNLLNVHNEFKEIINLFFTKYIQDDDYLKNIYIQLYGNKDQYYQVMEYYKKSDDNNLRKFIEKLQNMVINDLNIFTFIDKKFYSPIMIFFDLPKEIRQNKKFFNKYFDFVNDELNKLMNFVYQKVGHLGKIIHTKLIEDINYLQYATNRDDFLEYIKNKDLFSFLYESDHFIGLTYTTIDEINEKYKSLIFQILDLVKIN